MGVGREPSLGVFVHDTGEVFDSHLCGPVSHGREAGLDLPLLEVFVRLRRESLGGGLSLVSSLCL